jgi:peptide deformylase
VIIKDKNKITIPCDIVSVTEGQEIGIRLLHELRNSNQSGIGLAANQIGINKRVCVVNVKEPIVLINPEIMEKSKDKFPFVEGCLSFPKKNIKTERYVSIKVKADNYDEILSFSADSKDINDAFECACVQHEIDHLNGITMFDRKRPNTTVKREGKKIGRNDKVLIACGVDSKVMKYKKALPLLENGWTLVEQ